MKRLLLDTHVWLWWLKNDVKIQNILEVIAKPQNEVYVSAASIWEISIKRALGKLEAPNDLDQIVEGKGFLPLPISLLHGQNAGKLPEISDHKDPFDRMLIAQAQVEGLTIVTHDKKFARYQVAILWV